MRKEICTVEVLAEMLMIGRLCRSVPNIAASAAAYSVKARFRM